jgi:beta-mannosidase
MKIDLSGLDWKLQGYWAHEPLLTLSVETGGQFLGVTDVIPARVPGSIHDDLRRAGLIEDPYFELNSLKCEWVENRWWVYSATLPVGAELRGKSIRLVFEGVDYHAHFFLGQTKLGEHEGMFTPAVFDLTGKWAFDAENHLRIAIECAPPEMSQIGFTSRTSTQKSRFNYKWDFSTRLVNLGLWNDVYLDVTAGARLGEHKILTDCQDQEGRIEATVQVQVENIPARLELRLFFGEELLAERSVELPVSADEQSVTESFAVAAPKLWFPNGSGPQPLYRLTTAVSQNQVVSDSREFAVGIRRLSFSRNPGAPEDSLPYTVFVNDRRIYLKGVNNTPADHMYGIVDGTVYRRHLALMREMNVNLIRVWGGGLIEKEAFYELCDEMGFLVWQEFIQSSSGIDNVPGKDPRFLELLSEAATHAVKTRRNHVSLSIWSGGNELTDADKKPAQVLDANLAMLRRIVAEHDPGRLFLPTSASGPREFVSAEPGDRGTNHDVHGQWKYLGVEAHYRLYGGSDSLLHSEFGVDGCASARSLRKFLGPENLHPVSMRDNRVWRHHGEWWDVHDRQCELFGEIGDLDQYVLASQFVQAEGLRFIIEANRRREPRNSGSIIWQFNEPWPNVSCTSLVDYYFEPKMAFYVVKSAYAARHASLDYAKLRYSPGETFVGSIHLHNSSSAIRGTVRYELLDLAGNTLLQEEIPYAVADNTSQGLQEVRFAVPRTADGVFFVRLRLNYEESGWESENVYTFSTRETEWLAPLLAWGKANLAVERCPGSDWQFQITNNGSRACFCVHLTDTADQFVATYDRAFVSLFPGEACTMRAAGHSRFDDTRPKDSEFVIAAL